MTWVDVSTDVQSVWELRSPLFKATVGSVGNAWEASLSTFGALEWAKLRATDAGGAKREAVTMLRAFLKKASEDLPL